VVVVVSYVCRQFRWWRICSWRTTFCFDWQSDMDHRPCWWDNKLCT